MDRCGTGVKGRAGGRGKLMCATLFKITVSTLHAPDPDQVAENSEH